MNRFKKGDRVVVKSIASGRPLYPLTGTVADDMKEAYPVHIDGMDRTYRFFASEMEKISTEKELEVIETPERKPDKISHPAYYNHGIECIDYIQSHDFGFCLGNAIKYITRAGYKTDDPREDLKKAIRYLEFEIEDIEKKEGEGK